MWGLEGLNCVVVFNTNDPLNMASHGLGYEIPDGHACHTQSVRQFCNRYVPDDFARERVDASDDNTGFFRCVGTDPNDPATTVIRVEPDEDS